jgi:hypothetical protein
MQWRGIGTDGLGISKETATMSYKGDGRGQSLEVRGPSTGHSARGILTPKGLNVRIVDKPVLGSVI